MPFGVQESGFVVPTYEEIVAELEAEFRTEFGESINTQASSVFGLMIAIMAERELALWNQLADVYSSAYPSAIGVSLDRVGELTGLTRLEESQSTAIGEITGTPATSIPAGRVVQVDSTGALFETLDTVVIGGGGTIAVTIMAQEVGPVNATTLDTYTIMTPVSGWTSFAVTEDATLGRLTETDAEFRERREEQLRAIGSGTVESLAARLRELDDVVSASIEENTTGGTVNGVAAHGFRATVQGGDDVEIAQTIFDHKPLGIATSGTSSEIITDSFGNDHTINFSRPSSVNVYCDISGTTTGEYPSDGDDQILALIVAYDAELGVGDDVLYLEITRRILDNVPGILTLTVELGLSEGTEAVGNITIDFDELGTIADVDIAMT